MRVSGSHACVHVQQKVLPDEEDAVGIAAGRECGVAGGRGEGGCHPARYEANDPLQLVC